MDRAGGPVLTQSTTGLQDRAPRRRRDRARLSARPEPGTVLFVCTGNVCRSAYAEHALQERLDRTVPRLVEVASVGTQPNQALGVPSPLVELGEAAGLTRLGRHRPVAVSADVVAGSQLILTATQDHMATVLREVPRAIGRTYTMLEFAALVREMDARTDGEWVPRGEGVAALAAEASRHRALARSTGEPLDVTDPFGGPAEGYAEMTRLLDPAMDIVAGAVARAADVSGTAAGQAPARP